jgi:tRNA(Glu) U13 pseudouridine synthase TruD
MRLKIDLSDLAEELKNDIGNAIKGKVADEIEKIYRQAVQSIVYGRSASAYYSRTNGFLNSVSVGNPVFDGSSAMVEVGIDTESLVPNFNGNGVFNNYMGFD